MEDYDYHLTLTQFENLLHEVIRSSGGFNEYSLFLDDDVPEIAMDRDCTYSVGIYENVGDLERTYISGITISVSPNTLQSLLDNLTTSFTFNRLSITGHFPENISFAKLTQLRHLDLFNCNLTAIPPSILDLNLKRLGLYLNPIKIFPDGVEISKEEMALNYPGYIRRSDYPFEIKI
jgi:hypothetical protein